MSVHDTNDLKDRMSFENFPSEHIFLTEYRDRESFRTNWGMGLIYLRFLQIIST